MKKKVNIFFGTIIVSTIVSSITLASATTTNVGGGTWKYGTTGLLGDGQVYSEYLHQTKIHGASTVNGVGSLKRHWNVGKGKWAYDTRQTAYIWKTDHSYWITNS